jgi:hypothetical protein
MVTKAHVAFWACVVIAFCAPHLLTQVVGLGAAMRFLWVMLSETERPTTPEPNDDR